MGIKRRHSRTELPFWPGIVATPTQNCRFSLGSAAVLHGIAVLAWDRRQSRTELPFWPGIAATPARNGCSGLGEVLRSSEEGYPGGSSGRSHRLPEAPPCHLALGAQRGAPGSGKFRRFLNPNGVRAGWVVGSDARLHADTHFVTILNSDMPPPLSTLWRDGAISEFRLCPAVHPKP